MSHAAEVPSRADLPDEVPRRRTRREADAWASPEELEVLGGIGREPAADWSVLTLERDEPRAPTGSVAVEEPELDAGPRARRAPAEPRPRRARRPDDDLRAPSPGRRRADDDGRPRSHARRWMDDDLQIASHGRRDADGSDAPRDRGADDEPAARAASSPRDLRRSHRPVDDWTRAAGFDAPMASAPAHGADEHRFELGRRDDRSWREERPAEGPGGRRTVVIRGQAVSSRAVAPAQRRRPPQRTRDRVGHRPDRIALWAVVLGLVLILVAAGTSHAAMIPLH